VHHTGYVSILGKGNQLMRMLLGKALIAGTALLLPVCGQASAATAVDPIQAVSAPLCEGQQATLVGTSGDDHLVGTDGPDVVVGLAGDDRIDAGDGDDLVCGGDGYDYIRGGAGNDRLFAEHSGVLDGKTRPDVLEGGLGDDLLDIGADEMDASGPRTGFVVYTSSSQAIVVDLAASTATGEGDDTIVARPGLEVIGSPYGDVIKGSPADDRIFGYLGDDRLSGLAGDDYLLVDSDDSMWEGDDDDWADGGEGNDLIVGYYGADTLRGGAGDDQVEARGRGPSTVLGDSGNDSFRVKLFVGKHAVVDGGSGTDDVTFAVGSTPGPKQPKITVRMQQQTVRLAAATVGKLLRVDGVAVLDRLRLDYYGSPRADRVYAGKDARLRAWTLGGRDFVQGSREADFVDTGAGRDAVQAGKGSDTCLHAEQRKSCEITRS
jgi:Ca2+-binding RTX toxin-like protein